jgi:hypothetical protein
MSIFMFIGAIPLYTGDPTDRCRAGDAIDCYLKALFGQNSTRQKDLHRSGTMDL